MKKIVIFSILSVLICLSSGETDGGPAPEPPSVKPETTVEPTTISPKPITTKSTTTAAPTTQSPTPAPTTRPSTTTSTTTTSTTTAAPTTAAPVTTSKPTPKPKPEVGQWEVFYPDTNNSCLIVKMALEVMVHYERTDKKIGNATIIVPKSAESIGSCENNTQQITLVMGEQRTDSIIFNFAKNDTSKVFMLTSAEISITPTEDLFPKMKSNATIKGIHDKEEFQTPLKMSYKCKPENNYNLTSNNVLLGKLMISDLQVQAFHVSGGTKFDSAKDCEGSETPGIVPIAVGCSLAALIIIVLVAYLIGRRRSQSRGYLSM